MRENTEQKNSEYVHFSGYDYLFVALLQVFNIKIFSHKN